MKKEFLNKKFGIKWSNEEILNAAKLYDEEKNLGLLGVSKLSGIPKSTLDDYFNSNILDLVINYMIEIGKFDDINIIKRIRNKLKRNRK